MAVRFAVANGAWSSGSTWDNGAVPLDGDDVYVNGWNVTINQNINPLRITNQASSVYIPDIATPPMTSNTTPFGVAFASGIAGGGTAWGAFDQNLGGYWQSNLVNSGSVGYQFTSSKIIKQYAFYTYSSNGSNPKDWTFQGSNDGVSYTTLETVTGFTTAASTWYVRNISSNTSSFTYYRINITAIQTLGSYPFIIDLQMTESTGSVYGFTGSGNFISTNNIQISASSQYGINSSFGTTPTNLSVLVITGSDFVGITGSILGPNGGFSGNNRNGVRITNGGTASIIGDVYGGNSSGGSSNVFGLYIITGSAFITGSLRNINNAGNTAGSPLVINNGTASISGTLQSAAFNSPIAIGAGNSQVNFTGNAVVNGTSTGNMQVNIAAGAIGTLNYNGPVIGNNNAGIGIAGAATVNVTGSVYTIGVASGISSTATSTINVSGSITSGNANPGLSSTSINATVRVTGPLISQNNYLAVYSPKIQLLSNSTPYYEIQSDSFGRDVFFYDVAYTSSLPAQTNVRSGSLYGGSNEFSGSMVVPSTSSVRYGVPVDNTTGSATLIPQDIFDFATQNLTGSNTIGERLKNISTVQTTAATIAAFKGK